MEHSDFRIGMEFWSHDDRLWRCTDVGTRTVLAIRIDEVEKVTVDGERKTHTTMTRPDAEAEGRFSGPPYGLAEAVFDEYAFEECEPA